MKNQYMFFSEQLFEDFDLSEFEKSDTCIPNTDVHIYEFVCVDSDTCCDDETRAKKLDSLSQRLTDTYQDAFQVISSESSQFFCRQIYPLVVSFETKLRYALYISRALYENGNVNKESFRYGNDKNKKLIEEIDFGEIYDAVFTDKDLKPSLMKEYSSNLTKADLIKRIQAINENTVWRNIVGTGYDYIENHFLDIKDFRNDVMHSHLISSNRFEIAKEVLQKANAELDRVVRDKLIVNQSGYLNEVDVVGVLNGMIRALGLAAIKMNQFANSDYSKNMAQALALFGKKLVQNQMLLNGDTEQVDDPYEADEQEENENA